MLLRKGFLSDTQLHCSFILALLVYMDFSPLLFTQNNNNIRPREKDLTRGKSDMNTPDSALGSNAHLHKHTLGWWRWWSSSSLNLQGSCSIAIPTATIMGASSKNPPNQVQSEEPKPPKVWTQGQTWMQEDAKLVTML